MLNPTSNELDESRMPLWEHLDELRTALFRCLIAVAVGVCVTYFYSEGIVKFLELPLLRVLPQGKQHLYFTGVTDKFFIYLKIAVYSAVVLTSPYLLYEVWKFISPALYRHERRFAAPFIVFATVAFVVGISFAYFVVIPGGYRFLIHFGSPRDLAMITLTEYFSLTLQIMVAMGLVFELPILLMLLAKAGVLPPDLLGKFRKHAYVILAVVAGVITPSPDAFSMIMVLIPLWLLFEVSVVLVNWVARKPVAGAATA